MGGVFFGIGGSEIETWIYASVLTGAGLLLTELPAGAIWFRQVRGIAIMLKLALLAALLLWPAAAIAILLGVLILSSVVSHMPGRYRYWAIGRGPGPSGGGGRRGRMKG